MKPCKFHPAYQPVQPPPNGCFKCWKLWTYVLRVKGKPIKP